TALMARGPGFRRDDGGCKPAVVIGRHASPLAECVRAALVAAADPSRAAGMQAYMKSALPYLGVSAAPLRKAGRAVLAGLDWPDGAARLRSRRPRRSSELSQRSRTCA